MGVLPDQGYTLRPHILSITFSSLNSTYLKFHLAKSLNTSKNLTTHAVALRLKSFSWYLYTVVVDVNFIRWSNIKKVKIMDFRDDKCEINESCFYCKYKIAVSGDWVFYKKKNAWVRD